MFSIKQYNDLPLFKFACTYKFTVLGFLASIAAVITLSSTLLADAIYFNDPRHKDVDLEAWMTPRYVGMSYGLPRNVIDDIFGIKENSGRPRRLDRQASKMGLSLDELTNVVRIAAAKYREQSDD